MRLLAWYICFLFTAICFLNRVNAEAVDFDLMEVAEGFYVHQGVTVPFDHPNHDDIANIGFIIGSECVVVIDTGGSLEIGRALRAAIRRITSLPICYVINTHVHPDHILGNAVFEIDDPIFIGHKNLPRAIAHNREFFLENFAADLDASNNPAILIAPERTVDDIMELDLGGRLLRLTAHQPAHTDQDLSVLDLNTMTLWLGSLFVERIPALDGSIKGWITVMDELRSIPAKAVIPGNGPVPALWPEAMEPQRRYLQLLVDEIRELIAKGKFLEDALKTVGQAEQDKWLLFDQHHKSNVTRAFAELEWE